MKKLVLIDSNALVHRAFHALPPSMNAPDGQPTNAVYGFTSVLLKMMADLKPDYIAATFDLAGPTFRHQEYEQYKAHRVKAPDELYAQIPMVKEMLAAFGIPVYEQAGFEADDVIGSIAEKSKVMPDLQTIIVTGDMDTLQLVSGTKVIVFTLRKGMSDTVIYDEKAVRERLGIAPEQVPDLKGLQGDPSDNIPGVPGVGEKTASTLIQTFGTVEKLYEAVAKGEAVKPLTEKLIAKLAEHKDMADFSKKLATIIRTVDVQFDLEQTDWHKHLDTSAIETTCKELGFYSLIKRINTVLGKAVQATVTQTLDLDGTREPLPDTSRHVRNAAELPAGDSAAVQLIEHEGKAVGLAVTVDGQESVVLDDPAPASLAKAVAKYKTVIGHDIKPLIKLLPDLDALDDTELFDTKIAAWLCNPEMRDYSLERIYYEVAAQSLPSEMAQWTPAIWRLRGLIEDRMRAFDVQKVFGDIEMPLVPILARMERFGILVDTAKIAELLKTITIQVADLEREIYKLAGTEFNINSPSQLGDILFNRLAIRGKVRRTGGGAPSTAAPELEKLREEHPIIGKVLEYRELNKLKSTYIEPFPALVATDGRIHTTYNQTGAATGRLSSTDPNLQNIPTRSELGQQFRAAFIADKGYKFVSLDYSQLELRLVAHIAGDKTMIEAFRNGEDIHTRTASEVFGLPQAQVTKDMRRQAKVLNFGIIYGMGSNGFARAAGVNRETAKRFIEEYFARFPGVAAYMERTKEQVFEHGFVTTLSGRRRPLPDIKSGIPQLAAQAERMAINHPIQGTGADLMKLAMKAVDRFVRTTDLAKDVRVLLQVHDELVLEVKADKAVQVGRDIKTVMQDVWKLDVPIVVDVKIGHNWAEMEALLHHA